MAKLNPVTEYLKNVAKSVKYATVAYIDTNAPATKEFRDTNKELFQDITSAVRNYKGTIMQAESAVKNTPLYRQANAAFENTITAIKTGKFYNKDAEDAAMDAMFNTDEEYQDETQGGGAEGSNFEYSENGPDGADAKQSPVISRGEKSLMKVIHRTSSAQGKRIAGTVEASARYIGGINRASASAVLAQGQQMTSLMQGGFRDIHGGLNELNQFNQSVVKTLAENATQYFQITTGIMQENNAILKEMLEMQRNLYQVQNQDNTEFGGKLYNMVGAEGTPDLKEYGKNIFGNIKKLFNEKSYGMGDMLNEDMLRMFASNPTAAIPGFLISTALGPAVKTSLQQLNSTLSGVFTTAIARLNYNANAKKHDDENENNMAEILGKIFGVQDIDKNRLDTRSMNNRAVSFDFETRKAIIEIIPSQLSRIESAITGKPAQVYDMKQGRWMSMNEIKENFKNFRKGSISNATYQEQNELTQMMDEIHADRQTMIKIEEAIEKINSKRFDDYGYYDRSGSMAERANRYGVDDEQIMAIVDRMMQNLSKQTKMQSALNFTNAKTGYNNYLKQLENEGTSAYNLLFNGFDKRNALVTDRYDISDKTSKLASAFDLTQQKDEYGLTIYDYLRDIRENTWWGGQSGGYGNGQGNGPTNPTGPRTPHYNDREIMTADAMNAARENQADRMWENSQSQIIREAAARGENIPYLRNNERTSEEDMSRLMNNIDTRAQFMKSMQHIGQMEDNTNFLNRAIQEAAEKSRNSNPANGEKGPEAAATKSFAKKLVDAATIGQKFGVIAEGLQNLTMKPADLLTGVLTKADESIYGFFFNDTDASSPVVNGEKVKGFAGRMNYELGNLFKKANNWIDTVILGKDENGETHFKERLKEFTGIDIDKIKNDYLIPIKKGISDSIKRAIQTVKDSAKTSWGYAKDAYYNITGKPRPEASPESAAESATEAASTAASNAKEKFKENIADIQQHANGARNVTKTGLTIISKGERIIPSDENIYNPDLKNASRDKDRRNEEKIKQRLNQIFDQSLNIEKHADGTKSYGSSQSEVQKAAIANRPSTEEPGLGKQFMQQIFGDEQTLQGKITYANAVVKKHLPDAAGGAVVGGVAGTLLGGPLVGAVLGSAVNIVSNSEFLQKQLFGEKVVMADGSTRRKGGLFSQETQEMMKKYLPDMKALGITGTILGAVTGLGPIAGLAIGSAIGFAKNNESIQKALFGEHGMFNDKTKKMLKKAFPNMAIGTGAGALGASALLGVGGLGLLPFAVIGAGAGLVSSTDEFKDFLLGKKDEKGNRKGGLAGAIKETMVQPLASFANGLKDQFGDWLKDKMFKPVERAMAPIGKTIELGFKDTINFINKSLKAMFDPVTGIPIFAQIGWMVKKAFGPLETMGKKAVKAAGWIVSRPSAWIGAMGDKMRRSHIKSGNADYMTAQERLKFMGEDDYAHKDVDKKMAGSTVEELENMKEQFELFRKGRGYFDEKTNDTVREMGSTVTQKVGGDTGRASQIMKAVNAGDIEKAINLVDEARNISISQKRELYKYINQKSDELNRLRTKKANYDEDRASILKKLDKMGFKGVNEDNIDKYGSSLDTEIQSRKKLIGENAISDAQAKGDTNMANAAIITGSINDNFAELIPLMAESTQYLAQIAAKGGELSWFQNRRLRNQHNAGVDRAVDINLRDDKLSNKINKNITKALHTTKVSKKNRYNLLTDNALQDRLFNLGDQGYHLEDINTVLELKPKDRDRYLSLAELGYQVPDPSAIAGLTEKQFNNLTTLAKAGIRITDFDAVKNLDTDEAQIMADLYVNGYNQLNQGTLEGLAKTGGRALLAENDIDTAQKQMRKLNIKDTATEQGIAIGNKISNKYREAVRNATPNAEQQQQTEYIQPEVLNDLVDVPMYANGLKYADRNQLAIVSKGERIERADQPREHLRPQQYQSTLRRNVVDDAELAGRYLYRKVKNRIGGETTSTPASRDTTPMLVSTDYGPIVYDKDANGRLTYNKEATPSNVIKTIDQRDTIMAGISNNLVEIAKVSAEHEGFMKWYKKKEENKKGGILNWIMNAIMYGPLIYKFAKFLAKGLGLNDLSKLLDNLPKKLGDFVLKGIEKIGNKIGDIFGKGNVGEKVADIIRRIFGRKNSGENGDDDSGNSIDINKGIIKAIRQHNEDVVIRLDKLLEKPFECTCNCCGNGINNKKKNRDENSKSNESESKNDKRNKNSKDGKNKDNKKDNSSKKDNNGKTEPEKPSDAMKRRPGESKRQYRHRQRRIDEAKRKAAMDKKQKEEPAKPSKIVKDEKTGRNKRSKALEKAQELSNKGNKQDKNINNKKNESKIDKPSETVKITPKSSTPSKPATTNTSKHSTPEVTPPSKSIVPTKKSRKAKIVNATNKVIDKTGDVAQTISDNENKITDLTEDRGARYLYLNAKKQAGLADADDLTELDDIGFDNPLDAIIAASDTFSAGKDLADEFGLTDKFNSGRQWLMDKFHKKQNPDVPDTATPESSSSNRSKQDAKRNLDDKVDKAGASINNKFKDMKTAPTGKKKGFSKKALAAGGLAALALPFLASSVAGAATPDSVAEDQNKNLNEQSTLSSIMNNPFGKTAGGLLAMGLPVGAVSLLTSKFGGEDQSQNTEDSGNGVSDLLQETMDNIDIDNIKKKEQESDKAKDKLKELSEKQKDIVNKSTQPSSPSKAFEDAGKKSSNSLGTKLTDEAKTAEKTAKTMEEAQNGSAILNKGKSVVNSICSKIGNLIGGDKAEAFRKFFMGLYEKIMSAPGNVSKIVKGFAKKAGVAAAGASTGIGGLILGGIEAGLEIKRFYDGYSEAESLLELPPGSATTGMKLFAGAFNALWEFDLNPLNTIFDSKEVLHMAIPAVGKLFGITEDTLRKTKEGAEKDAKSALQTAKDVASSVEERVKMTASSAWDKFKDFGSSIWDDGKKAIGNAWDKFKDFGSNLVDKAKNFGSNLWNGVKNLGSSIWNGAKSLGSKAYDLGSRATTAIGNALSSGIDTVKGGAKTVYNAIANSPVGDVLGLAKGKWGRGNYTNPEPGFFSQRDPAVADLPFNISGDTEKQTVGDSLCGPMSGLNTLADYGIQGNFEDAYKAGLDNKEKDGGTFPKANEELLGKYGFGMIKLTKDQAKKESDNGTPIIAMGTDSSATKANDKAFGGGGNKTPYGKNPHWISFTGKVVKDPESNKPEVYNDTNSIINKSSYMYAVKPKSAGKGKYGRGEKTPNNIPINNNTNEKPIEKRAMYEHPSMKYFADDKKNLKSNFGKGKVININKYRRYKYGRGGEAPSKEKMWALANWCSTKCGVAADLIYGQWYHESGGFSSRLAKENYNFGGMTQNEPTGDPSDKQPDGGNYYMHFANPEEWAEYFAWYLNREDNPPVAGMGDVTQYAQALKSNGYYGAGVNEYIAGIKGGINSKPAGEPNMSLIDQSCFGKRDPGTPSKAAPNSSSNSGNNNGSSGEKKLGGIFGELSDITSTLAGAFSLGSDSSNKSNSNNSNNNQNSNASPIAAANGLDMQYIESNHPGDESKTNLSNINPQVKTLVNQFAKDYYGRHNKKLLITGGAELGYHSKGKWSHGNGYKTDVDTDFNDEDMNEAHQLGASVSFESDHYDIDWSGHDRRDQNHPHNAIYSSTPPAQAQGKWGRGKYGRGLEGIPQDFLNNLSDYNKINDSDDLMVRQAKEANIRKLYNKQQQSSTTPSTNSGSFDMSKVPEYNRISPDDDLFVQRMKKMSWRKYGYTGEGKWGRGIGTGIKNAFQTAVNKLKDTSKTKLEGLSRKFGKAKWGRGDGSSIYQSLMKLGFNDVATAGIMGNMRQENTNFDPNVSNESGHHGLFQWDPNYRWPAAQKWCSDNGMDPNSVEGQLAYAHKEAVDRGIVDAMNACKTPEEAAILWERKFEISGGDHDDNRIAYAKSAYESKGKDFQTSGDSSGGNNNSSSNSGIFKGIANIASKMSSQMKKLLGPMAKAVKSMSEKVFGSDLKLLFGDSNPFGTMFGSDSGSPGGGNSNNPSNSNSPGGSTEVPQSGSAGDKVLEMLKKGDSSAQITSSYGKTRSDGLVHGGIDYGANSGTPIYTPVDGKVFDLGEGYGGGYGNFVQIQDAQGNYHMFAHCDTQTVSKGQSVKAGDQVGTVGSTGHSTGPHLHYEIDPPNNPGAVKSGPHFNPGSYGTGKWGRGKWGKGIDDIPQEFINGLADYNKISDDDDLMVRQAKEANIRRLYEKSKQQSTPVTPASSFDMSKVPEYNRISPDDDLFVQRMKKMSWRKYGYTGEGKWGRGAEIPEPGKNLTKTNPFVSDSNDYKPSEAEKAEDDKKQELLNKPSEEVKPKKKKHRGIGGWFRRIGGAIGDFATNVWHKFTGKILGRNDDEDKNQNADESSKSPTTQKPSELIEADKNAQLENDIKYIMTSDSWKNAEGKNPTREEAIAILNKDKKYNGSISYNGDTIFSDNDIKYIMTAKEWQDKNGKNPTKEQAIEILKKDKKYNKGKGKYGRGLEGIPQEFINGLADYNKISDSDDNLVRQAKEANIRKLYEKNKKTVETPATSTSSFDMSKVPEYNRISPDDDLFVQRMKKMSWRKYGYTGEGKWGRGIDDIPQEFINGLADYNKISDDDDLMVRQAKEANIRRLYEKSKRVETPAASTNSFDMSKVPEYNRISPDDDLFVQRMKKMSWRKYGYTGEGKWGRGFGSWLKRIGGAIGDFATNVWHNFTGKFGFDSRSKKEKEAESKKQENKVDQKQQNMEKVENDIKYIMTAKEWQDKDGKNPSREQAIKILNKTKDYPFIISKDGKKVYTENDLKYIMTDKAWQDSNGKNPTREEAIDILYNTTDNNQTQPNSEQAKEAADKEQKDSKDNQVKSDQTVKPETPAESVKVPEPGKDIVKTANGKWGKGKYGRGLDDIPQEFINGLADYNKISDDDDLMVRQAKEANIRRLYEKSKQQSTPVTPASSFDMSKVPEYNRISPDDDLFVQRMKKMSWRKYGYTGEGKWGRGDNPIQNYYSAEIDKKYKVGNIKNRVDFILHPHKRFLDDGGMKTVEDIKNYIKDVPEAAIDPMNKIDYKNDDLTVMRAKAKKIREIYDSMSPDEKAKLKNGSQPTAPVTFMKAPEPGKNLSKDANFAQNRTVPGMVNKTANSPAPKLFDDMPLAMEVGPNGKNIDENDIKYIMTSDKWKDSTGKNPTREQAIAILQKDKKYAISPSTAVDTKTSTGNKSDDSSKESEEDKRKSAIEKEAQKILSQFGSSSGGSDILSILRNSSIENRKIEINKNVDLNKVLKGEKDEDTSSDTKEESVDKKQLENDIKYITTSEKWKINGKNPTRDEAIAILKKDPKYKDKDIDKILKESAEASKTDDKKNPKTPAESVKYATKDGKELENDIKYIMESDQWKRKDGSHPTRDEAIAILKKDPKYKDKDIDKILKESAEASKTDDKKNPKTPAESTKESSSDNSSKESEEDKKKSAIQKEAEKILRQTGVSSGGSDILSVLKNSQLENRHIEIDKTVDPSKILKGEKDKDESSGKEGSKDHKDLENDIKYIMNAKEWQINGKNPTRDEAIAILKKDPKYKDKDIDKILKEESGSTDEKEKGVNGKTIDENDIKYIMTAKEWQDKDGKNPSREQAIAILKNDKKYSVNTTDTKDDSKKSSSTTSSTKSTTDTSNKTDDKKNPQTPAEAIKDAKNSSTSSSGTSSSDFGPNGKPIDENDIKFIMTSPQWQDSTGKNPSREQAIKILQNDVKYAVDVTSEAGEQKAEDNKKEDEKKNPETPAKTVEKEKAKEDNKKKEEEKKQDSSKKTEDKKTEEKKDEDKKSEIKTPAESIKSNNKDKEELENDIKYIMTAKEWQRSDGSHPTRDEAIAILKKDPKYKDKDIDKILSGNVPSESVKVPEPGKDLKKENNFDTKKDEKKSEDNKKPQAPAAVVKAPEPGKGLSKGANFDLSKDKKSKQATPVKEQKQGTLKERIDNILHPYKRFGDDHGLKTVEDIKNYIKGIPEEAINPENRIDWDNDDLLVMRAKAIRIKQDFAQTPDQKKDIQKLLKTPAKVVKAPEVKKPEKAKDEKKKPEEVKEKKGTLKERIDAILHPYKRFGDDHGLKTVEDIKKYIQDVPDSFISDDNKIDWEKDDLLVMRMKALKIRQLYDAHLKEAGITPQESKAKAVTIDPNKPKDTNTVDKNTKDTANKVAGALAVEVGPNGKNIEENDIKYIMTAKEWQDSNGKNPTREEAIAILQKDKKYAIDNTNKTQAEDEKKKAEEEKKKQEAEAKQKAAEEAKKKEEEKKQASETKSNSDAKSDDKTQTASSENSVKFDKMIELLSSIDQSLKAIAGASAISGGSTTTGKSTSNTIRNSAPSPSVEQFDAIARNMSKLATM